MRARFDSLISPETREVIKDQPLLVVHGQDDTLIQPWVMKEGIPILEQAGFDVTWALLPDMRHNVTGQALAGLCSFIQDVLSMK
jgi:predicted esterase